MARKKKRNSGGGGGGEGWLTTYTDLCTLLMTFFVLLISMSVIDENRKREALNSLVGAFGLLPAGRSPIGAGKGTDVREGSAPLEATSPLNFDLLKEVTLKNNLAPDIEVTKEGDKFLLRINQRVLFEPGTVILHPELQAYLAALAAKLKDSKYDIEIRGHIDPYEDLDGRFDSHHGWALSAQRAQAVARFLLGQGLSAERISAHGFGSHWPVVDGLKLAHLRYKNSRVEIVLGRNELLPTTLVRQKPRPIPYYRYRNFWFRLFPERPTQSDDKPN